MKHSKFMEVALGAVKEAEKVVLSHYNEEIQVERKKDESPVTVADREAEKIIIGTIRQEFPDHGFMGEEYGNLNPDAEYKWIIDPIDGTANYIRKIPFFGTLIALVHNNEVIIGVSNIPLQNELLYAEKGTGAFLNGRQVHVTKVSDVKSSMVVHGSQQYFVQKGFQDGLNGIFQDIKRVRGFGDLYMYHPLASGRTDVAMEAKVNFWDIAPAVLIVQEAGGLVTDLHGNPVTTDSTTFLATNGLLHEKMVQYFK